MKPFCREEENNSGKNLNTVMIRPFVRDKDERKNEDIQVEIVCATDEDEKTEIPETVQEVDEVRQIKPFERVEPMIAEYSRGVCKQFFGESSSEVESKIALLLQKEYAEKGVILQNFTKCEQSCLLNFNLKLAKKIIRVYDTENGEVKKYDYDIWIQVTKQQFSAMMPTGEESSALWDILGRSLIRIRWIWLLKAQPAIFRLLKMVLR